MVCLSYWLYNKFMNNLIVLNGNDNVGVSQFIIPEKTKIEGHNISTLDPIPFGHKVCLKEIKKGDPIIKYDQIIGFALNDIKPGEHVHSHNLEFREFKRDFKVTDKSHNVDEKADTFFNGILRDNGQVATRNYIGIVSTVNCSATVTKMIVEKIKYSEILKDYPNIDGIVPITHSTGCGMNTESEGMQIFQRTIDGFKNHPNFSHVFVIGLGCECAQVSLFDESLKKHNRIHFLTIQDEGGTKKIVDKVLSQIKNLLSEDPRFDPNRFYYSGFSYGAGNALKLYSPVLARANPPWKALVAAEPGCNTAQYPAKISSKGLIIKGEESHYYPPACIYYHKLLQKVGNDVELVTIPKVNHFFSLNGIIGKGVAVNGCTNNIALRYPDGSFKFADGTPTTRQEIIKKCITNESGVGKTREKLDEAIDLTINFFNKYKE